ncbi:hypothetical protein [Synechococcus sp. EJ6-Ellesmere]|uniref:hypothetical protein n=1 Tax=Synechococcus sp. EJ6-Ellesmere TaxID=2823734 RepID=UPI0020CCA244|nr:hypothetical protein [Synechococcus sp. EJ6-Ellesmere]MCP9825316.1 hypothetical protein [Synechococcus sp. EJ6-Ellesmere]
MPPVPRGAATGDRLGSTLGEKPAPSGPAGPWRVTARISGGLVQISNNHESRVIRKAEVEAYLRKGKSW